MTQNIKAVDFNGVKVRLDANTQLFTLLNTAPANSTMHKLNGGANYQVPALKKATVIFVGRQDGLKEIFQADDLDGVAGKITLIEDPTAVITDKVIISIEVPALKFINNESLDASDNCTVIEENV